MNEDTISTLDKVFAATFVCLLLQIVLASTNSGFAFWNSNAAASTGNNITTLTVAPPTITTVTRPSPNKVDVTWTASPTNATRAIQNYWIFRRPTGPGAFVQVGTVSGSTLTYRDTPPLPVPTQYDYVVQAFISDFTSPNSNIKTSPTTAIDSTPPTTTIKCNGVACSAVTYYTANVSVTLTATDPDDSVASITRTLDGTPTTTAGATVTFTVSGDGTHTLTFAATDSAGNVEVIKSQTIKIDTVAPVISSTAICDTNGVVPTTNPNWINANATFVVLANVTDATSGVASVTTDLGVVGSAPYMSVTLTLTSITCNGVTYNYSVSITRAGSGQGVNLYYYDVIGTDNAGNVAHSNGLHTGNLSGDTTNPTTPTGLASVNGGAGTGKITLNWNACTDTGGSGFDGYHVNVFLWGTTTKAAQYPNGVNVTGATTFLFTLTSGTRYDFQVQAADNAGNNSALSAKLTNIRAP